MENLNKTDIGLIGLAVMGENLALNMADKGWRFRLIFSFHFNLICVINIY